MAIIVTLDVMLAKRQVRLMDLAEAVGITLQNLSILKAGKAKAIRFSTLNALCCYFNCQPGDLLQYAPKPQSSRLRLSRADADMEDDDIS